MPITVWSKEKNDSPSLLSGLQLEVGRYNFVFGSNVITRNTILLVAEKQKKPFEISNRIIAVEKTFDDGKEIVITLDVKKGSLPDVGEAGAGKVSLYAAMGLLGILGIAYLARVEKLDNIAKNVGGFIGNLLSQILLSPGILVVVVIAIFIFASRK